jgi:hypothetical protein
VEHLLHHRGLCEAFQTGNGKTLTAAVACECLLEANHDLRVVVISPMSLLDNFNSALNQVQSRHRSNYTFYTYEKFAVEWRKDRALCDGAVLVVDEAHHLRTEIFGTLKKTLVKERRKLAQKHNGLFGSALVEDTGAREVANERKFMDNFDQILDTISGWRQRVEPPVRSMIDEILINTGVSITRYCPRALCVVDAARRAIEVILLTATPCFNGIEDTCNLVSAIKGWDPMNESYFNYIREYGIDFRNTFHDVFAFRDVDPGDKDFPDVKETVKFIEMSAAYYREYRDVELRNRANWSDPWKFLSGVRQATNGLKDNPKCDYIFNRVTESPNVPTVVLSAFVGNGIRKVQERFKAAGIPFSEITGDVTKSADRVAAVKAYQEGKNKLIFLSDAGSEGLDLSVTERIFTVESDWNRQKTDQRIGRGRRRGSKVKCVTVERLVLVKPPEHLRDPDDKRARSADELLEDIMSDKQKKITPFLDKLRALDIYSSLARTDEDVARAMQDEEERLYGAEGPVDDRMELEAA